MSSYMTLSTNEFWCKLTRKYPLMPYLLCCKRFSISLGFLDLVNQTSSKGKFFKDLNRDFSADSSFICLISSGSVMISQPCLLISKGTKSGSSSSSSWLSVASGLGSVIGLSDNKAQHTCLGILSITELDPVIELSPSEELRIDQVEELVAKLDTDSLQDRLIGVGLDFSFIIWQRPGKWQSKQGWIIAGESLVSLVGMRKCSKNSRKNDSFFLWLTIQLLFHVWCLYPSRVFYWLTWKTNNFRKQKRSWMFENKAGISSLYWRRVEY